MSVSGGAARLGRRWPQAGGRFLSGAFTNLSAVLVIVLLWEIAGRVAGQFWLPPFSRVVARLYELIVNGTITPHLLSSLSSLAIGFLIALTIGLTIGILMGLFSWIHTALDVYVNAFLFTPGLIFAPILFAIFGLSPATRISVVVIYALFIIIINTATAIRNADQSLLEMAASYGAPRWKAVGRIALPDAFPLILAGIRLGAGRAVKGMINGEMFIALVGLGGQTARFGRQYDFTSVWAMSLFIMLIAVVINQAVSRLESRATSWID